MNDDEFWLTRVQQTVRGVEFFYPNDENNPAPGRYVVSGPTSEIAESGISIAHAAMQFLAMFKDDSDARAASIKLAADANGNG